MTQTGAIILTAVIGGGLFLLAYHNSCGIASCVENREQSTTESQVKAAPVDEDHRVKTGDTGYLRDAGANRVAVFKTSDAMDKAYELVRAGADTRVINQYVACFVPTETKVLRTSDSLTGAFMSGINHTSDVTVTNGPFAGCKGVVVAEQLQK